MSSTLAVRAEKAAQILKTSPEKLIEILSEEGVDISVIDSSAVEINDLADLLYRSFSDVKPLPLKAAAGILKDPQGKKPEAVPQTDGINAVASLVKELKPIEQWDDRALLESFAKDRTEQAEQELHRRAKQRKFVVLKPGKHEPGKEDIDIETTLDLLKTARKREVPGTIPIPGGFAMVYRITELNILDRVVEICPICGETLWKGYCENCQVSLGALGDDERAYMKLVADSGKFDPHSFSDRKAVVFSATKGLEDLRNTWPSVAGHFDELKALGNLPKLKIVENRPSTAKADPFHVDGNRVFGNRSY